MNYISILFSHYYVHIMLLIWSKKLELRLIVVSVLLKIKFEHLRLNQCAQNRYTDVKNSLYQPLVIHFTVDQNLK